MKKIILILLFISGYSLGFAQTSSFRVKLYRADEPVYFRLEQTSADIEGYDGDEITVETVASAPAIPPPAAAGSGTGSMLPPGHRNPRPPGEAPGWCWSAGTRSRPGHAGGYGARCGGSRARCATYGRTARSPAAPPSDR